MTGVVLAALALLAGAPWLLVVILLVAVRLPVVFLAGVAGWTLWARRSPAASGPSAEADLLRGMAAELAAGASLRGALVAASDRAPSLDLHRAVRLAAVGFPARDVGEALREALPHNGRLVAPAFRLAAETGGRAAGIMTTLAARADDVGALARERRALTAQARLSAWIVPPWARTRFMDVASPNPIPRILVLNRGSNNRSISASEMPHPASATRTQTMRPFRGRTSHTLL